MSTIPKWFKWSENRQSLSWRTTAIGKVMFYALIAASMILLLAPIIIVVGISFNGTSLEAFPPQELSLRWYGEFLQHPSFFSAFFFVSLPIAILTATLATIIGVFAAYALVRYDLPYENALQSALLSPMIVPAVIVGIALMLFFARYNLRWNFGNLIVGHTLRALPYTILTAMTSLYAVDEDLELAARNLGASKLRTFRKVTLPLMSSGVISGFLLAFIFSFADINIALFIAGGDAVTLPLEIFMFLRWESSPIIAAIATVQILLVLVLVLAIGRLVGFKSIIR